MSWYGRVVWSEGMFLQPQHFQQQQRHLEHLVEGRCAALAPFGWGLSVLRLDEGQLSAGKIALAEARGIFPDGTPFSLPDQDLPPPALDIPENVHQLTLYLGLPIRRENLPEVADENTLIPARQRAQEVEVRDISRADGNAATLQVSGLNLRILSEDDDRGEYSCIPLVRILESRSNREIVLDDAFVPTVMQCQAAPQLRGYLEEMTRLLRHRSEALAGRVAEAGRGGNAELSDFLLLQVVNRFLPLISHYRELPQLHPELLYRSFLEMAGELSTFTLPEKRPDEFPTYDHEDQQASFEPVLRSLRQSLSMVLDRNAIPIPLQERKYGVRVAAVFDRKLLVDASFILVVRADMSVEELRRIFPTQVKIGPVEKIRDLVNLALPGILLRPLPVAPRQLPFRSNSVYFELDRSSEYWKQLHNSGGFAIHVSGEFPGIQMEFWAIRE